MQILSSARVNRSKRKKGQWETHSPCLEVVAEMAVAKLPFQPAWLMRNLCHKVKSQVASSMTICKLMMMDKIRQQMQHTTSSMILFLSSSSSSSCNSPIRRHNQPLNLSESPSNSTPSLRIATEKFYSKSKLAASPAIVAMLRQMTRCTEVSRTTVTVPS